jgi:hypothetical protein
MVYFLYNKMIKTKKLEIIHVKYWMEEICNLFFNLGFTRRCVDCHPWAPGKSLQYHWIEDWVDSITVWI